MAAMMPATSASRGHDVEQLDRAQRDVAARRSAFSMRCQKRWCANVRSVTRKSPAAAASRSRSARSATCAPSRPMCGAIRARRRLPRGTDDARRTATSTSITDREPEDAPRPTSPGGTWTGSTDSGFAVATEADPGSSNDAAAVSAPTAGLERRARSPGPRRGEVPHLPRALELLGDRLVHAGERLGRGRAVVGAAGRRRELAQRRGREASRSRSRSRRPTRPRPGRRRSRRRASLRSVSRFRR